MAIDESLCLQVSIGEEHGALIWMLVFVMPCTVLTCCFAGMENVGMMPCSISSLFYCFGFSL